MAYFASLCNVLDIDFQTKEYRVWRNGNSVCNCDEAVFPRKAESLQSCHVLAYVCLGVAFDMRGLAFKPWANKGVENPNSRTAGGTFWGTKSE